MARLCLALIPVALLISLVLTEVVRRLSLRAGALDTPGVAGQVKAPPRPVPNTGGIAIFAAIALPLGAALLLPELDLAKGLLPEAARVHLAGLLEASGAGLVLLVCLAALHLLGLVDDRRPLGPWVKLIIMLAISAAAVIGTGTRLLTFLDPHAGGPWLSIAATVLWIALVANALNFLDNMDGLSAGVGAIASAFFLAAALVNQQWFVGGMLALLVGALLGFLWHNFPIVGKRPRTARIFMGDGGSLVVGFLLGFLTARTTYFDPARADQPFGGGGGGWYAVLMPLVVLAIPLYDFVVVSLIRISQGRSPFVGDLNHLSHRLVRRGLSRRAAVVSIWGLTAATAIGGISLGSLQGWQAALVGVQTLLILGVLAVFEYAARPAVPAPPGAKP